MSQFADDYLCSCPVIIGILFNVGYGEIWMQTGLYGIYLSTNRHLEQVLEFDSSNIYYKNPLQYTKHG